MNTQLANYLSDASGYKGHAEKLFIPADESELSAILADATKELTPVTISGAGTGLAGGRVAQGGWVISMEKFRRLELHQGWAIAVAAVPLLTLRDAALPSKQFYAPDPTEITASVGGTIATNASGSRSFRFGSTRRHIKSLRVAFADGRIAEFRKGDKVDFDVPLVPLPDTKKCTAGYRLEPGMDWIDLICGSEGTLAVVMEAELQLLPLPANIFGGIVFFGSDEQALDAVDAWRETGNLRMLEYVGKSALDFLRARFPDIPKTAAAALLIEGEDLEGWDDRLEAASAMAEASWFSTEPRDRERFRKFRHSLPELVIEFVTRHGFMKMGTDYAVPVGRNRDMLRYYQRRLEQALPGHYVIYGHIGDAHVHVNMLPASSSQAETAASLLKEFAAQAVEMGGTVSAEHGLGKRKAGMLALQFAPEYVAAMMTVKRHLDPHWLLCRGNLFPAPTA